MPSGIRTMWRVWNTAIVDEVVEESTDLRPVEILESGHEVALEEVLKYTKTGRISIDNIMGKVASFVLELGGEVKAGRSRYFSGDTYVKSANRLDPGEERVREWIECALDNERIRVCGTEIFFRGGYVGWKEFLELHESGKSYWEWYTEKEEK